MLKHGTKVRVNEARYSLQQLADLELNEYREEIKERKLTDSMKLNLTMRCYEFCCNGIQNENATTNDNLFMGQDFH